MMRSLSILIIVSAMTIMMVEAKPKTYLVETADADHDDPRTSIDSIPEDGYFPPQNRLPVDDGRYSGRYAADEGRYAADEGRYASDEGRYAADEGRYSADEGRYAADEGRYAADEGRYVVDEERYVVDEGRYAADDSETGDDYYIP